MKMKHNYGGVIAFFAITLFFTIPFIASANQSATSTPDFIEDSAGEEERASSTPSLLSVTFHIRYQDTLVFEGPWEMQEPTVINIKDNAGVTRMATSTSVLGVLLQIDEAEESFEVTDIAYFESFGAFIVNCIYISERDTNACFNWQYVVNGIFPPRSMDSYLLQGGDDVFLFFGPFHQTVLEKSEVEAGEAFVARSQEYQYQTDEWGTLIGVSIGVIQENPENPFLPVIITTSPVDDEGRAELLVEAPGEYQVGIAEDFYFPSVGLSVLAKHATSTRESEEDSSGNTGGGGGGGSSADEGVSHKTLDTEKAIQFLANNQKDDGSFGSAPLYTDWSAIALGAYLGSNEAKAMVTNYLLADSSPGNLLTDYERRAMALMALGINPYRGTSTDYIQKIIDEFDGNQFGDPALVNDDIFALFPLLSAGMSEDDPLISKTVSFILSRQEADGSWLGVDMSAAAVQALSGVSSLSGVPSALERAKEYLKSKQQTNGGFEGNVFSTSWAMQAIAALGEDESQWTRDNNTPGTYLANEQRSDGGVGAGDANTRLWATAYAIPASLAKTWYDILESFPKEEKQHEGDATSQGGGGVGFVETASASFIPTTPEETSQPSEPAPLPLEEIQHIQQPEPQDALVVEERSAPLSFITPSIALKTQESGQELPLLPIQEGGTKESIKPSVPPMLFAYSNLAQAAQNIFRISAVFSLLIGAYILWRLVRYFIIQ